MIAAPPASVEAGIKWLRQIQLCREELEEAKEPMSEAAYYIAVETGMAKIGKIKDAVEAEQRKESHDHTSGTELARMVAYWLSIEARRPTKASGYAAAEVAEAKPQGVVPAWVQKAAEKGTTEKKTEKKTETALVAARKQVEKLKKEKGASDRRASQAEAKAAKADAKQQAPREDQEEIEAGIMHNMISRLLGMLALYWIAGNYGLTPITKPQVVGEPKSEQGMAASGEGTHSLGGGLGQGADENIVLDLGASTDIIGGPHLERATDEGPANATLETANSSITVERKCSLEQQDGIAMKGLAVASSALSLVSVVPRLIAGWTFWGWNEQAALQAPNGETHKFELDEGLFRYRGVVEEETMKGRRITQRMEKAKRKKDEASRWFGCLGGGATRSGAKYSSSRQEAQAGNNGPGAQEKKGEEETPSAARQAQDDNLLNKKNKTTLEDRKKERSKVQRQSRTAAKKLQTWLATALLYTLIGPPIAAVGTMGKEIGWLGGAIADQIPSAFRTPATHLGMGKAAISAVGMLKNTGRRQRAPKPDDTMEEHVCGGHQPFREDCLHCAMARIRARSARRRGPDSEISGGDKGYVIGLDVLGPMPCKDTEDHEYVLVGVEVARTNYGFARTMKDKSAASVKAAIVSMRTELAAKSKVDLRVVRIHSDRGPEFERDVESYLLQDNIEQTDTGGYRAQGNSRTERMIGTTSEVMRTNLWQATAGESEYDPLWGEAVMHAMDRINRSVRGIDGKCPHEELTGERVEREADLKAYHPFGCHVIRHRPKEHRESKLSTPGVTGIWVGKSTMVKGADRVMQVRWDATQGKWQLGKVVDADHVKCDHASFPLREGTEALTGAQQPTKEVSKGFRDKYNLMRYAVGKDTKQWRDEEGRDQVWGVDAILDYKSKGEEGKPVWKVQWEDGITTWERKHCLTGCKEILEEFEAGRKESKKASVRQRQERGSDLLTTTKKKQARATRSKGAGVKGFNAWVSNEEDVKAVLYLLRRQKRTGTVEQWLPGYRAELDAVTGSRLRRVLEQGEMSRAKAEAVPMRINLEPKHDGRKKCRFILQGFREPRAWDGASGNDSPVAGMATIRTLVFKHSETDLEEILSSADITTAFLQADGYGPDERTRYVSYKPYPGADTQYFQLLGPIYGQRSAPKAWYETFTKWLVGEGFEQGLNDPCIFYKPGKKGQPGISVVVYVDDVLVRATRGDTKWFYERLEAKFKIKDPTYLTKDSPLQFLGFEIGWEGQGPTIDQAIAMQRFLEDKDVAPGAQVQSPMPTVAALHEDRTLVGEGEAHEFRSWCGTLNYFAVASRFDIAFAVAKLSQFSSAPTVSAVKAMKRVVRYLKSVPSMPSGAKWEAGASNEFRFYSDSDHCGDKRSSARSHTGTMVFLNGAPVYWRSHKQPETAVNSAVAEIYALSETVKSAMALGSRAEEMGVEVDRPLCMQVDNAAAVSFQRSTCPQSKVIGWIDAREARVRELRDQSKIKVVKVDTSVNCADILTKGLPTYKFKHAMKEIRGWEKETEEFTAWLAYMQDNYGE